MTNQTRFGANLIEYRKILKFLKSGIQLIGIRGKTHVHGKFTEF